MTLRGSTLKHGHVTLVLLEIDDFPCRFGGIKKVQRVPGAFEFLNNPDISCC